MKHRCVVVAGLIMVSSFSAGLAAAEEHKAPPLALIGDIRKRVINVRAELETERAARAELQALFNRQSAELRTVKEAMGHRERELLGNLEVAEQRGQELREESTALKKDLKATTADLEKEQAERRAEQTRAAEDRAKREASYEEKLQTAQTSMRELQAHLKRIKESAETKEREYAARLKETEEGAKEELQKVRQAELRAREQAKALEQELEDIKQSLNGIKADFESSSLQDSRRVQAPEGAGPR